MMYRGFNLIRRFFATQFLANELPDLQKIDCSSQSKIDMLMEVNYLL